MSRLKVVFVSIQSVGIDAIKNIADSYSTISGTEIGLFGYSYGELNDDKLLFREMLHNVSNADLTIVRCMSDPDNLKRFSLLEEEMRNANGYCIVHTGNADIRAIYRPLFKGTDDEYFALCKCMTLKGDENEKLVFRWIEERSKGNDFIPEPVVVPCTGIYHSGRLYREDACEYLLSLDPSRPTVGIVLDSNLWLYQEFASADALIADIEERGMNTIPILFSNMVSKGHELYRNSEEALTEYFVDDGRTMVDAIVVTNGFSLLVNSKTGGTGLVTPEEENYLRRRLNVPMIHIMTVRNFSEFSEDVRGLEKSDLFTQVVWPEVDGQIIAVPYSVMGKGSSRPTPIDERIDHIGRMVSNWVTLKRTPMKERKIAILMYQSSSSTGGIGSAGGLDTVESVARILNELYESGYSVPKDHPTTGAELVADLIEKGITNDLTSVSDRDIDERSVDNVSVERYKEGVFDGSPEFNKKGMCRCWGEPPGEIQTSRGRIVIPGKVYDNVFVGFQPPRAMMEVMDKVMHDPDIVIPHQYLEYYHWLQYDFGAQAVVHMGTHGSIEWLPGKSVGLSQSCYPDLTLDALPHFYPYLINDPGEGIQTKRRTEAVVIGHMSPPMGLAGSDGDLSRLESLIQEYLRTRMSMSEDRKDTLLSMIAEECVKNSIFGDLGIDDDIGFNDLATHIEQINDYLFDLKGNIIRTGLHILGEPLKDLHKDEEIYSIMRLRNGSIPSFREAAANACSIDLSAVPSMLREDGRTNSEAVDELDSRLMTFLSELRSTGYSYDDAKSLIEDHFGECGEDLEKAVRFICDTLSPNIDRTTDEMSNLQDGFCGQFVPSGPSGAPTRSGADILPTGRNFYTLDPESVPTRASWDTGCRMAEQMISRFVDDKGDYPHDISFIMWATDNMKTNGDDIAYVLWLMGVRPIWSDTTDHVNDLEVVPLEELGRPRLDVTIRITGLFRDTFPNAIDLIDDAVNMIADLDESDDENYLRANLRKEIAEDISNGVPEDEARRRSLIRMFGSPPGNYGVGVDVLIDSGKWDTTKDLADAYVNWSCYAYGRNLYGTREKELFHRRFRKSQITIKNMSDRETDIFDVDDVYTYLGGMNAFVREYGDNELYSVIGDDSDPDNTKLRSLDDECRYVFRSKVLNPKFLNGLKEHGYAGVSVLMNISKFMIGWDGTSDSLDEWMYEKYCEKFLFDEATLQWMMDNNPDAVKEIVENLSQAESRGFWSPDGDTKSKLKDIFLDSESRIEERGA